MLLSGGIDSATCLYLGKRKYRLKALTFRYHGIARSELIAAKRVARSAGVADHTFYRLPDLREATEVSGGEFAGMAPGYIPMRNGIFYSIAASYAEVVGADFIIGGHNKDDLKVFRDTSPEFFAHLQSLLWAGSEILQRRRTRILRPLARRTKADVIMIAASLGVPFELTWSCHREGKRHCWECEGCMSRRKSFEKAGIPDPLGKPASAGKIS